MQSPVPFNLQKKHKIKKTNKLPHKPPEKTWNCNRLWEAFNLQSKFMHTIAIMCSLGNAQINKPPPCYSLELQPTAFSNTQVGFPEDGPIPLRSRSPMQAQEIKNGFSLFLGLLQALGKAELSQWWVPHAMQFLPLSPRRKWASTEEKSTNTS